MRVFALLVAGAAIASAATAAGEDAAFEARIDGGYEAGIEGPGAYVRVPGSSFAPQGYWFLADDRGDRPHGVTFVLPVGIEEGRHELQDPQPFEMGTVPSVRIDRLAGNTVLSSTGPTEGWIELDAIPEDVRGGPLTGRFSFETVMPERGPVTVEGRFDFMPE